MMERRFTKKPARNLQRSGSAVPGEMERIPSPKNSRRPLAGPLCGIDFQKILINIFCNYVNRSLP